MTICNLGPPYMLYLIHTGEGRYMCIFIHGCNLSLISVSWYSWHWFVLLFFFNISHQRFAWGRWNIDLYELIYLWFMICVAKIPTGWVILNGSWNNVFFFFFCIGSSTACIVTLNREERRVYSANLGDSGFLIIRDGEVVHRSEEQQHYFNTPFQLAVAPPSQQGLVLSDRYVRLT